MIHPIIGEEKVTVGTSAVNVGINCRAFLIKNNSDNATVYFCEAQDDVAVTADSGYALAPGESIHIPLCARTLSLIASAEADVRLLYMGEGW